MSLTPLTTGDALVALAASQGGVLLTAQAISGGYPARALERRLLKDGWVRIYRGAWAAPGYGAVDDLLRIRAVQLRHPKLVASHRAAAALHDIELLVDRLEFSGPPGSRSTVGSGGVVHRLPLGALTGEVVEVAGVRVTSVPRTLADLLRGATREEALVAVESAVGVRRSRRGEGAFRRPGITMLHEIDDALGRASVASASGTKAALETLSMADPAAGSPAETVARLRMYEAGLRPCTQVTLVTPSGRRVRPDFLFVGEGLVVEIEGYRWHGSRAAHRDDVRRFNELQACREVRRVLRFTAYEVFHGPQRMLREIRQGLADLSPL